jgi:hypothetical protein
MARALALLALLLPLPLFAAPPDVPREIHTKPGRLVCISVKTDAADIGVLRTFADEQAFFEELSPRKGERRFVFQSDNPGAYVVGFWTAGEKDGVACTITVAGDAPTPTPSPTPAPTGKISRFVVVEDTAKAGKWRGDVFGSPKVATFCRQLQGDRPGSIHRIIDINADGPDPAAVAYRKLAAAKPGLPWLWLLDDRGSVIKDLACPTDPEAFLAAFELRRPARALGLKLGRPKLKWAEFGSTPSTPLIKRGDWQPVNLAAYLPAVYDQDGVGQCARSSSCTMIEASRKLAGLSAVHLSAGDLYARVNGGHDDGALLEDVMSELAGRGVATVQSVPYLWDGKRHDSPTLTTERGQYRVVEAYLCTSFDALASALQQGFFVQVGVMWADGDNPDRDGWLPAKPRGRTGGHALCGYGLAQKSDGTWGVAVRNSWGAAWGHAGDCVIPESRFDSTISGWWAVRAVVQTPSDFPVPQSRPDRTLFPVP